MLLSLLSALLPLPPKRLWTQLLKWSCSVEVEQSPSPQDAMASVIPALLDWQGEAETPPCNSVGFFPFYFYHIFRTHCVWQLPLPISLGQILTRVLQTATQVHCSKGLGSGCCGRLSWCVIGPWARVLPFLSISLTMRWNKRIKCWPDSYARPAIRVNMHASLLRLIAVRVHSCVTSLCWSMLGYCTVLLWVVEEFFNHTINR